MMPRKERRHTPRLRLSIGVKQRIGRAMYLCQAGDISPGGLLLARAFDADDPPTPKCWIEFSLPESPDVIRARGTIVRQEHHEGYQLMAVAFTRIAPSHRRQIDHYTRSASTPSARLAFLPPSQSAA